MRRARRAGAGALVAWCFSVALSGCTGEVDSNTGLMPSSGGTGGNGVTLPPGSPVPGRVTAHRLNSFEYDNTIRDLTGLDLRPSEMFEFPADEFGDGFNNDADVLTVSSISVEKYLEAALFIISKALDAQNAAARSKILVCDPEAGGATCVKQILSEFARRAFRRPLEADEITPYSAIVDQAVTAGDGVEVGLSNALAGILVTPDFLYRVEPDPVAGAVRKLNPFEIATRLSYFVWASMPDSELFEKAEDDTLADPRVIEAQVTRMLADSKSQALVDVMVEQWARTNALGDASPNVEVYPTWQPALLGAMEQEVRSLLTPIFRGDAVATDLLTANYVYANRLLGEFYGLPGAAQLPADEFVKVQLTDSERGGIIRQGSFLVLTSHPDTHSPTGRGKFILEKLLCIRPLPPPAAVPEFNPQESSEGTLREKLETLHLTSEVCGSCHRLIDPMGFAVEHYDGAGLWRDTDNGLPVDASGAMPETEEEFDGAAELSALIAGDPRFANCMAKQMLTYALGRTTNKADLVAIEDLGGRFAEAGFNWPSLIQFVATSVPMTHREAE